MMTRVSMLASVALIAAAGRTRPGATSQRILITSAGARAASPAGCGADAHCISSRGTDTTSLALI